MVNGRKSLVTDYRQRAVETDETLSRLRAERDQLDEAIGRWERHREAVEDSAARAGVAELVDRENLRRSRMSAAMKSRLIRQLGKRNYDRIPWD